MWAFRRVVACGLVVTCVLAMVPMARADVSAEHAAAVAEFEAGTKLADQGDCPAAISKFQESLKKEEGVGAHLNLADCYEKTGAIVKAWREFKLAERFATLKRNDERREVAHERAYALEGKIFRITFDAPLAEGLVVRVNGEPLDGAWIASGVVGLEQGRYEIEASATRKKLVHQEGVGRVGEVRAVTIVFEDAAAPPPIAEEKPAASPQRTLGLAVGAAGLVAVGVGGVFGLVTLGKKDDIRRAAAGPTDADYNAARSDAHSSGLLSTIFFIGGGVALAGGAALHFTAPSSTASKRGHLSFAPAVGRSSAGLTLFGEL